MKTLITSDAEIKALLGLGSANDALVAMWNDMATEMVCDILQVDNIATHVVTDERVKIFDPYKIHLNDFPVDTGEDITLKFPFDSTEVTGFTFDKDPREIRTIRPYDSSGNIPRPIPYKELLISYTAGYSVQDTLLVNDLTDLAGKTITVEVAGTSTTWTIVASGATSNEINIGGDVDATATAIATALGGTASTATVTLPLGSKVSLGTATASQFTITNANIPALFKSVVALIAGGGIAEKQKKGGVVSYTIGGKTVRFRDDGEANAATTAINNWLSAYKKADIMGI